MSFTPPTSVFGWLAGVSVPLAVASLKYAFTLNNKFVKMSTLFEKQSDCVENMERQQKEDGIKLALHDQVIQQLRADLSSINSRLEPLPRISTMLEGILPTLQGFVGRSELDHRFRGLEQADADLRDILQRHK